MISFKNDYSDIGHIEIIKEFLQISNETHVGYGLDKRTKSAIKLLKSQISPFCQIHFLGGGTITNKTVIAHILKPYEAVISPRTGHIEVHETGAIEQTGHKIIACDTKDGKLTPQLIEQAISPFVDEHMVKPKLIYISNATETGLIYQKQELIDLYTYAQDKGLYLYMDGARLGVALTASINDLTLKDIATYTDLFYIGGTKNGALFGEAFIINNKKLMRDMRFSIKQNGALLAKGFNTALQFEVLFRSGLFYEIGQKANQMSDYLKSLLASLPISINLTPTNQQFITLPIAVVNKLKKKYLFEVWHTNGDFITIRLITTYQTKKAAIDRFIQDLKIYLNISS